MKKSLKPETVIAKPHQMAYRKDGTLFKDPTQTTTGTVYRGVCASIRACVDQGLTDPKLDGGIHSQARALAAAIDRASGLGGRKQETYALAALHRELGALLARVRGVQVTDELGDFLRTLAEPEAEPDPAP